MSHRSGAGALARARLLRAGLALLALVLFAALSVDRAQGAGAAPVVYEGQTVCTDIKPQRKELLVAPPALGTNAFDDGTLSGSYTLGADNHLAWASDGLPVDYVLVHGAGGTSYYEYPGGTKSDAGLAAPNDGAIDAVRFCYDNQNRGTVRIIKQTYPAGATERFWFHPSAELSPADFDLADGESIDFRPQPGVYDVTEADTPGWHVDGIACDDADSTGSGSSATIVVDPGETVTCTFTNREGPPVIVEPEPNPPVIVSPPPPPPAPVVAPVAPVAKSAVKAAVASRGTARLRRPARCVSGSYRVTVSGSPVRRIEFTVNGRRVRTVIARGGQRTFTVSLPITKGTVQRVAARVVFSNGARSRTLRATVVRCAQRQAVSPQFTG
jgi:hypothetical protein